MSDEFYHKLTMLDCQLSRSYLTKQRRDQLNKMCSISRLPGKFDGCEVDFEEILTKCLQQFVNKNPDFDYNNSARIKFSGDGAQMSRDTNFVILTVAMLDDKNDAMAAKGNHTLAVVKASEKYEVLKEACGNHLIRTLYPNKIIVSNKLLGLLGLGLGFGSGFILYA